VTECSGWVSPGKPAKQDDGRRWRRLGRPETTGRCNTAPHSVSLSELPEVPVAVEPEQETDGRRRARGRGAAEGPAGAAAREQLLANRTG